MTVAPSEPGAPATSRGRRSGRTSGDERERAILSVAEQLLATRPLDDISIDDLARGAGISRPTFYFYFASKDAVLLQLLDRVIAEVEQRSHRITPLMPDGRPDWRSTIDTFVEVFSAHRDVTVAAISAGTRNPEIRQLWSTSMARWVDRAEAAIASEQQRGAAPVGLPPRQLSTALNTMNEQVLTATFTRTEPYVAEDGVSGLLLGIWVRAIYGTA